MDLSDELRQMDGPRSERFWTPESDRAISVLLDDMSDAVNVTARASRILKGSMLQWTLYTSVVVPTSKNTRVYGLTTGD